MSYQPPGTAETSARMQQSSTASEVFSLVDRHTSIEGDLVTNRDIRIEGKLRGTITCEGLLYIAEGADIDATVDAAQVTVAGKISGVITSRGKLQITDTGRVTATVHTQTLVIDEGAFYEGELNMGDSGAGGATPASEITVPEEPPAAEPTSTSTRSVRRRFSSDDDSGAESEGSSRPRKGTKSNGS